MSVHERIEGDVAVVTVSGKMMGGSETNEVHEKVKSLTDDGLKKIVIDLSKVKWMNSKGLGMLMACMTTVKSAEGELKLAGVVEKVKSLFMITQLIKIFETAETADRAVAGFK